MMKRLFIIIAAIPILFSCSDQNISHTLKDVESYIMERPDSALTVLESIERSDLRTPRNKAHHALLHAMALDKNYIDVADDSIAQVAVDYYQKHGPMKNRARALYYLGKSYFYQGKYDRAILEYSKAEKIAEKCDSLYLGMTKSAQADTYNRTHNSIEELNCANEALEIFKKTGQHQFIRPLMLSLGVAMHNKKMYSEAINIFNEIIKISTEADYYMTQALICSAHSMIELDNVNYEIINELFTKALEYNAKLSNQDYWAWAYSLYRIGKNTEADKLIEGIQVSDEIVAHFWKSRIALFFKDYETACIYDELTDTNQNDIVEDLLTESLATYQRDYYRTQLESSEYKVKTRTIGLFAIITLTILLSIIIFLLIARYIKKQQEEKDKLFEYAEEIKRQLNEAEQNNDYSLLKRKYLALYKSRFETIGTLTDQYFQADGRTDIESLMFRKVTSLINEVKNDSKNRKAFEAMLDKDLDGIMTHIRTEMPRLKELDYSIFSYLIVGFDATTISRLLDISVNNIYAHKRRLRIKIEERTPEHADQFLEILN